MHLSNYFYGAQRCGNTNSWAHGACHVKDGQAQGIDLTGGWHDCGDHILFGQTAPYSAAVIIHAFLEFPNSFEDRYSPANSAPPVNGIPDILDEAKIFTDWLIKAHTGAGFYFQKGDGTAHQNFAEPRYYSLNFTVAQGGESDGSRPVRFASSGASNIAGDAAAALALMAIAYQPYNAAYATECYNKAKDYLATGEINPGGMSSSPYYTAANWADDMAWGAISIRRAAVARGNSADAATYLTKAQNFAQNSNYTMPTNWSFCYDRVEPIAAYELFRATGNTTFRTQLQTEVNAYRALMTSCGYAHRTEWGSLRHAGNMAYIAGLLSLITTGTDATNAYNFTKANVDFILGTHTGITGNPGAPAGMSFLVGYTNPNNPAAGSARRPHHRSAFGKGANANSLFEQEGANPGSVPYLHQLRGAVVGGPRSACGNYHDRINDFVANEVGLDYNAGFVGALAVVIDRVNPSTPTRTPTPNLSLTRTFTPTVSPTFTITPVPPPTNRLNLEVMRTSGSGACVDNGIIWTVRITNWDTVAIPLSGISIRVWLNSSRAVTAERYDGRVFNASGADLGTFASVSAAETAIGSVCSFDGRSANKYVTITFGTGPDIPANGGYLTMNGIVRNTDWSTPFDAECNDYTQMLSTWTALRNEPSHTLYQGTNLVCEYINATTQDANTGINPCTGGNGCAPPGSATPTRTVTRTNTAVPPTATFTGTPTRTNTSTPSATATPTNTTVPVTATFTRTPTRTNTSTPSATATATNTAVPPTATFTGTATRTGTPTFSATATPTNTAVPATATFTGTATRTGTPTFSATATPTNTTVPPTATFTGTPTGTQTRTATPTNTAVPPTATFTATQTATPTQTATQTRTSTPSATPTDTRTATRTSTPSATPTDTRTATRTSTPTFTVTMTHSITQTHTVSPTVTETVTGTPPTLTNTPTVTETSTITQTDTATATPTFTSTPSVTATNTPQDSPTTTYTRTPTETQTEIPTDTPVNTPVETPVNTYTRTPTQTFTPTATNTVNIVDSPTSTPGITAALTATRTVTHTAVITFTATPTRTPTATPSRTVTPAVTPAATLTATPQPSGEQKITGVAPVPNPFSWKYNDSIFIDFKCVRNDSDKVVLSLFTQSYRLVYRREYSYGDAWAILSNRRAVIEKSSLPVLANGTYFVVITAEKDGVKAVSNNGKLVILR